jgi:hypothetical protein
VETSFRGVQWPLVCYRRVSREVEATSNFSRFRSREIPHTPRISGLIATSSTVSMTEKNKSNSVLTDVVYFSTNAYYYIEESLSLKDV